MAVRAYELPTTGIRSFMYQRTTTHWHRGIDLLGPEGRPVYSVANGRVTHASRVLAPGLSGYGAHVVVQASDGTYALYAHLRDVDVSPGQYVRKGTRLGTVGRTCYTVDNPQRLCQAAHLHFEVSPRPYPQGSEEDRLDPVAYLQRNGVHPYRRAGVPWGLVAAAGLTLGAAFALRRG